MCMCACVCALALKLVDEMKGSQQSSLSLSAVAELARECGVADEDELHTFLRFMTKTSTFTWMEDAHLREVVILDAIEFLVPLMGMIICQLNPDTGSGADSTTHETPKHRETKRALPSDYLRMTQRGVASNALLSKLLEDFEWERVTKAVTLLAFFGFIVPIRAYDFEDPLSTSSSSPSGVGVRSIMPGVEEFIVPAHLPALPPSSPLCGELWTGEQQACHTCLVWFSTVTHMHELTWLSADQMQQAGFTTDHISYLYPIYPIYHVYLCILYIMYTLCILFIMYTLCILYVTGGVHHRRHLPASGGDGHCLQPLCQRGRRR